MLAHHVGPADSNKNYCNLKALQTHDPHQPCPTNGDCTPMNQG